jgi:beta-phosphoglucomutase-like phosphatase (HAD superfamily)
MEMEIDAPTNDVIAMNLTIAALDQWLKNVGSERNGEELGREIGAMYRVIHAAVDEMSPEEDDDDFEFDDEDEEEEEEEEEEELEDERD